MFSTDFRHRHFMRGRRGWHGHDHGFGHHGFGRGGRSNRGNMKYEILSVLQDGPRHGYDIMLEIEQRRGGFRPSPGSIYPALQMLEDGDFITGSEIDGKRVYTLTEKGRTLLADHLEKGGTLHDEDDEDTRELFIAGAKTVASLMGAIKQIAKSGNAAAVRRATEVLEKARREIYTIMADEL